jgi:hypothetical protein
MRRGNLDKRAFKSACRLRRQLIKLIPRFGDKVVMPRPSKKFRKPIKFVPAVEPDKVTAVFEPRKPLAVVSKRRAAHLAIGAVGSRFESFGVQCYLEACEEAAENHSFTKATLGEIPMDDDTYICCSADPVVQIIAKGITRRYKGLLVVKKPAAARKRLDALMLELTESEFFGLNHSLRQVADVAEGGGFLGSGDSLVGKTFMYVDGEPVLVELS